MDKDFIATALLQVGIYIYIYGLGSSAHSHLMAHVIGSWITFYWYTAAVYLLRTVTDDFCKVMHVGFGDQLTVTVWAIVAFYFKCFCLFVSWITISSIDCNIDKYIFRVGTKRTDHYGIVFFSKQSNEIRHTILNFFVLNINSYY